MLKVDNDAVVIHLNGTASDPLFYYSIALLVLGVAVAAACFVLPVAYAIAALAAFAVLMFMFNLKKQRAKSEHHFCAGVLRLTPRRFEIAGKALTLSQNAQISQQNNEIIAIDRGITYRFGGFENDQERHIVQSVLSGKAIATRAVDIQLQNR